MNELLISNFMTLSAYSFYIACTDRQIAYERAMERIVEYETEITLADVRSICADIVYEEHLRQLMCKLLLDREDLHEVVQIRNNGFYEQAMRRYQTHLMQGVSRYRSA